MLKIAGFAFAAAMLASASPALAQSAPVKILSQATPNATLVLPGNVVLKAGSIGNSTATQFFLKLYNKATQPVCGIDVPKWTVVVQANQTTPLDVSDGVLFPLGLGICLTGAIADNDTSVAAAGVSINLGVSKR
jgi:hypothetical protein